MHSTVKHISTLNPFCPVIFLYCLTWSPNNDDCTKSGWYIFEQCMHFGGGWVGLVGGTAPVWGVGAWVLVGGTSGWGDVWGGLRPVRCGDASAQCGGGSKKGGTGLPESPPPPPPLANGAHSLLHPLLVLQDIG